jgi:hypothetical protein
MSLRFLIKHAIHYSLGEKQYLRVHIRESRPETLYGALPKLESQGSSTLALGTISIACIDWYR